MGYSAGYALARSIGGQISMVGSSRGAVRHNRECKNGDTGTCSLATQTLQYATAMVAFKIDDELVSFMNGWRGQNGGKSHKGNISHAEKEGFMAAWMQKVLPCS